MSATIQDVARHAGVSAGTVSNALTGKRHVAEATHQRILAAMNALGYRTQSAGARSLVNTAAMCFSGHKRVKRPGFLWLLVRMTRYSTGANQLG